MCESDLQPEINNLYLQTEIFNITLASQPELRAKVIAHIQEQFFAKISSYDWAKTGEDAGGDDPTGSSKQLPKEAQTIWSVSELSRRYKLLFHVNLQKLNVDFNQNERKLNIKAKIGELHLLDSNEHNTHYKTVFEFSAPTHIIINSQIQTVTKQIGYIKKQFKNYFNFVEVNISPVKATLTKPFAEKPTIASVFL